jgi:predicted dehydrogenase
MKIGIVGSGKIVNHILSALSESQNTRCSAICVREQSKEKAFYLMQEYSIDHLFTDYDLFLCSDEYDFVYIGLPNRLHYSYALKALQAGKNVICEKPFTIHESELTELVILAKEKNLFLFEAITTLFQPNFLLFKERIKPASGYKNDLL